MKTQSLLLVSLFWSVHLFAQPAIQWQKCLGGTNNDYAYSIQQTNDNGYIIAGYTTSNDGDVSGNHGNEDFWVVKLDNNANLVWQKCLGGTNNEQAKSIHQTSDGGYIVAGFTLSNDGDVNGNHGNEDFWVVKLNATGTIQWQKCFGGTERDFANFIQETSGGGYIVAGYTYSNNGDVSGNNGNDDFWIVKLNGLGNIVWQKCLGGTESDYANSVQQLANGNYLITGYTYSNNGNVSGNNGSYDSWVVVLDGNGNLQWQQCYGGSSWEFTHTGIQTAGGGFITAGSTKSNNGDVSGNNGTNGTADQWIVMLNSSGNIQWQKCLGGTDEDIAFSIQQTNDGGFVIGGNAWSLGGNVSGSHGSSDFWVVKLDANGNLIWQKCLGGSSFEMARSIRQTNDGGFVLAGFTLSNNGDVSGNHGVYDAWVIKLLPVNGPLPIELLSFTGEGEEYFNVIRWITASETNNDFFTLLKSEKGNNYEAIAVLDGAGNSNQPSNYIFIDSTLYLGTNYYMLKQTDYNGYHSFSEPVIVNNLSGNKILSNIYPNPVTDALVIRNLGTKVYKIEIYDIHGENIMTNQSTSSGYDFDLVVDVAGLPNGIYLLQIQTRDNLETKKFIVSR